ncbi:hypothetical protein EMIT0215P_80223 [Pseudomonas serboccidentalis]
MSLVRRFSTNDWYSFCYVVVRPAVAVRCWRAYMQENLNSNNPGSCQDIDLVRQSGSS